MSYSDELIEGIPFYGDLTDREKSLLRQNYITANYARGETIHGGKSGCTGMIFIKKGGARVYMLSEDGREITLYRLNEGDVCALSASCVIQSVSFDVFVEAEIDTDALIINSQIFKEIYDANIKVQNYSLNTAVERFSDVMWTMQQILFTSLDKRLAIFLHDEAIKEGGDTVAMTHEEIARYIGSARETVSRMLKYFEGEKIVSLSRKGIDIIDKNKLKNLIR